MKHTISTLLIKPIYSELLWQGPMSMIEFFAQNTGNLRITQILDYRVESFYLSRNYFYFFPCHGKIASTSQLFLSTGHGLVVLVTTYWKRIHSSLKEFEFEVEIVRLRNLSFISFELKENRVTTTTTTKIYRQTCLKSNFLSLYTLLPAINRKIIHFVKSVFWFRGSLHLTFISGWILTAWCWSTHA